MQDDEETASMTSKEKDFPYEPAYIACRRFNMTERELRRNVESGMLWWALNKKSGRYEVVGHLPGRSAAAFEKSRCGERMGIVSFVTGDSRGFLANLAWGAIWWILLFLLVLPFSDLQLGRVAFSATGLLGLVVWWSKVHPAPDVVYDGNVVRVPIKMGLGESYACTGGDLFDEVSTRRREDLQYLLGIGKYSKENW